MNTRALKKSISLSITIAIATVPAWSQQSAEPEREAAPSHYKLVDLGVTGPNSSSPGQPFVITDNGLVSAETVPPDGPAHAVIYYKGATKDIGTPGLEGPNSAAWGINILGEAVGQADTSLTDPSGEDFCGNQALGLPSGATTCLPFLWHSGVTTALPTLRDKSGKGNNGAAKGINNWGQVVGTSENTTLDSTCPGLPGSPQKFQFKPVTWFKPFLWAPHEVHELPTVGGDPDGIIFAVNELGQSAGTTGNCATFNPITLDNLVPLHAVLWQNGKATELPSLGGDGLLGGIYADGLNNRGQVVGSSDGPDDAYFHAVLWEKGGNTDLGTLSGDANSVAVSVNDRGQIVGLSLDAEFNPRAVVWNNGKAFDLNSLVPANSRLYLLTACSINLQGEIIGIAIDPVTMETHAYLATPAARGISAESEKSEGNAADGASAKLPKAVREMLRRRWSLVRAPLR